MQKAGAKICLAAALWLASAGRAAEPAGAAFEQQVLASLNAARRDPIGYAQALRRYRSFFHGKIIVLPHDPVRRLTSEGTVPLDEAIAFLSDVAPPPRVAGSSALALGATDHVREQSASGAVGHYSRDGASPAQRLLAHGGGGQVAEVISYGATDAEDVVRQLIIDDGVPGRGHRAVIFNPALHFAGVSCGRHPVYRTMCVIDLSPTWNGQDLARATLAEAKAKGSDFIETMTDALKSVAHK